MGGKKLSGSKKELAVKRSRKSGDHLVMDRNMGSLRGALVTNIVS